MDRKNFYSNIFWQLILQIVKYIYPLMLIPYLARVLEPNGYSLYVYILSVTIFCQVFVEYGFNLSGTKYIANNNSKYNCGKISGNIIEARIILAIFACLAVYAYSNYNDILIKYKLLTLLFAFAACIRSFSLDFIFQGMEKMKSITTRTVLAKTIATIPVFFTVTSVKDISYIAVYDIVGSFIAFIWSIAESKRLFSFGIIHTGLKASCSMLKKTWLYCVANMASLISSNFSTIIIGIIIKNEIAISHWTIAMTAISAVQALYAPVINALYVHILIHKDKNIIKKIIIISVPVLMVGTVIYINSADIFFLIFGGDSYVAGSSVMVYTSPVIIFSFFSVFFGWPVLGAYGHFKLVTLTIIYSALFCIISLIFVMKSGIASMEIICAIRCISELILCCSRIFYCLKYKLL